MSAPPVQLHGLWLHIALAISAGYNTAEAVGKAVYDRERRLRLRHVLGMMERHGLIERIEDRYALTRLCLSEMPDPPP